MKFLYIYTAISGCKYSMWLIDKQLYGKLNGLSGSIIWGDTTKQYKIAIARKS